MAIAIYNESTNKVKTFIRDDYPEGFAPPAGYTLVASGELPGGWTLEEDTSHADFLSAYRTTAKSHLDAEAAQNALLRGTILVLIDEINLLRQWTTDFKAQTALASNLADFKTRTAGLSNMPARTGTQARTAIKAKIDAGDADQ